MRLAFTLLFTCRLDRLYRLCTSTYCQLSAQLELGTGLPVNAVMGGVGVGDVLLPADSGNPRSGGIETLLRLLQHGFVSLYSELDTNGSYDSSFHRMIIERVFSKVKAGVRVLPRPEGRGFPRTNGE